VRTIPADVLATTIAAVLVLIRTVPLVLRHRQAPGEPGVSQRSTQSQRREPLTVVTDRDGRLARELAARTCGHVVDGAAESVAPIERSLRALHHLDTLEVELIEVDTFATGDVNAIEENGRIQLAENIDGGDTTNHGCGQKLAEHIGEGQARRERGHIVQVGDAARFYRFSGEGCDRERDVEQLLAGFAGRDDDFFEDRDVGCSLSRLLRQSRRTRSEREHGDHRGRDKTVG